MFRQRHKPTSFTAAWPSAREIAARLKGETRPDPSGNFACIAPSLTLSEGLMSPFFRLETLPVWSTRRPTAALGAARPRYIRATSDLTGPTRGVAPPLEQ
jgi:hypothetical protein